MDYMADGLVLASIARDYAYSTEQYHHHPWYEVYFLNQGSREFACGGRRVTLRAGEAFLARPGALHYAWGDTPHEKYALEFSERFISRYLTPVVREEFLRLFDRTHIVLSKEEQSCYRRVFLDTMEACGREPREESLCFTGMLVLLGILKQAAERQPVSREPAGERWAEAPEAIRMAAFYIRSHFASVHSLEEVAEACYLNKYYLCRGFKRHTGMTVMEYINMLRLEQACELLVKTELPVGEIAESCGFMNKSHFSTLFRKNMGASPLEFKRARRDYRCSTADMREGRDRQYPG